MTAPFGILFVCQGGLNRSVMAAALAPEVFHSHGVEIRTGAAAAFHGTEGKHLSESIRTLVAPLHSLAIDSFTADYLTDEVASGYDYLCFLDREAACYRLNTLHFPQKRICLLHVADPEYDGRYTDAFAQIRTNMGVLYSLLHGDGLL